MLSHAPGDLLHHVLPVSAIGQLIHPAVLHQRRRLHQKAHSPLWGGVLARLPKGSLKEEFMRQSSLLQTYALQEKPVSDLGHAPPAGLRPSACSLQTSFPPLANVMYIFDTMLC